MGFPRNFFFFKPEIRAPARFGFVCAGTYEVHFKAHFIWSCEYEISAVRVFAWPISDWFFFEYFQFAVFFF